MCLEQENDTNGNTVFRVSVDPYYVNCPHMRDNVLSGFKNTYFHVLKTPGALVC
jgi:hypothetical protein